MQYFSFISDEKVVFIMSEDQPNYLEYEYEHLYNTRDQTMLFMKICPHTDGYVDQLLAWLDEKVEILGRRLSRE